MNEIFNAKYILVAYMLLVFLLVLWVGRHAASGKHKYNDQFLTLLDWFETRGLGTFFHLLVFVGTFLLAIIGWRIPAEIGLYFGNINTITHLLPNLEDDMLARVAQVIGALGFGYIALRAMRFFVPIFIALISAILFWAASAYIFGLDLPKITL